MRQIKTSQAIIQLKTEQSSLPIMHSIDVAALRVSPSQTASHLSGNMRSLFATVLRASRSVMTSLPLERVRSMVALALQSLRFQTASHLSGNMRSRVATVLRASRSVTASLPSGILHSMDAVTLRACMLPISRHGAQSILGTLLRRRCIMRIISTRTMNW